MKLLLFAVLLTLPLSIQAQFTAAQQRAIQSQVAYDKISDYLNNLKTLKARFQQGTLQQVQSNTGLTGTFYLDRPKKFRLEYDQNKLLSLSDGRQYIFYDGQLKETTYLPLSQLPFAFLLQNTVDLKNIKQSTISTVVEETVDSYNLYVSNANGQTPPMTFVFGKSPVQLKSWYYVGNDGQSVWVKFNNQEENIDLDKNLFRFIDPKRLPDVRGNRR